MFRRAGMLRVRGLDELFAAVETLEMARPPRGDRLAIVTNERISPHAERELGAYLECGL